MVRYGLPDFFLAGMSCDLRIKENDLIKKKIVYEASDTHGKYLVSQVNCLNIELLVFVVNRFYTFNWFSCTK